MTLATRAKIEWFKNADLKMWEFKSIYEFAKKEVEQMSMLKNPSKKASDDLEYYRELVKVAQSRLESAEVA